MKRFVVCICVLMLSVSCVPDRQPKLPEKLALETNEFVIFLTGYELGALKPCGCSGGQLGGLDRRWAVLNSVPEQRKLTIDVGSFVESNSEQDLIKFNIIIQALGLLDYDLANLTQTDIEIADNLGLLDYIGSVFNVISAQQPADANVPAMFTKQLSLQDKTVAVRVAAFDARSRRFEQIGGVFPPQPGVQTFNILILNHCDSEVINSITEMASNVDCLVCPSDSDEPMVFSNPNDRPLAFSVGRFGRYVCRLNIKAGFSQGVSSAGQERLELSFHSIPVVENLKQGPSLVRLYKDYQHLVKESHLLDKFPRFALQSGLKYEGSKSCNKQGCHEYEYKKWRKNPHAQAYKTLVEVGSQYDPECVVCHVVGMDYESGFISEAKTGHLKDVGCENCHGPGSQHNRTEGLAKTTEPKMDCLFCHTPEKSAEYAGNEQQYLEKIRHWKEPNTAGNVQQ